MPNKYCTRCGAALEAGAGFCRMCGAVLDFTSAFPEARIGPAPARKPAIPVGPILAIGCLVFAISFFAVMFIGIRNTFLRGDKKGPPIGGGLMQRLVNKDITRVTDEFFSYLTRSDYKNAYTMLDTDARGALNYDTFKEMMLGIGEKLGGRRKSVLSNIAVNDITAGGKSSRFYVLTYETRFEKGNAVEEITIVKVDNITYVHNYSIKSDRIPMYYFKKRGPGESPSEPGEGGQDQQDRQEQQPPERAVPERPTVNI